MKRYAIIMLFPILFAGCTKNSQFDEGYHHHYFPMQEGHWVTYSVDSTAYNKLLDTVITASYLVRETVEEPFSDLTGAPWHRMRIEVMRDTSTGVWSPGPSAAIRTTRTTAEKIENNFHFIKLSFPFRKLSTWKGNSYINFQDEHNCDYLGKWDYRYTDLFVPKTVNKHLFDSVVVIRQVADSGLICKNYFIEMYAPGIGLIYKHQERLSTQNTAPLPFHEKAEWGHIVTYRIIDWKR